MQIKHHGRVRTGAIAAVGFAALLGTGVLATPASAHTPKWSVTCDKVTVNLTAYDAKENNTVTVTVDGKDLLPLTTFHQSYQSTLDLAKHSKAVSVHIVVKAGNENAPAAWNLDDTKSVAPCAGDVTPPSTKPSTPPSTTPAKPTPVASTPSAPVVKPSQSSPPTNLAETGGSSSTPLIGGIAAVVVAAGAGLLFMNRKRRTSTHS
ncbi:LAETG motif-containing sortase-dependent surface protein [Streptomyces sp. H10-C2]|uniref:LAETG motif-containing sortase-dependent surface protein n=1 Tax=unclassified Streptomyces TaxID=2593676 RepID=UPI0024BA5AD9|nr:MULTISPECIES: LAETG motif-containing sortase-dependent surface protein [unclassified Streptomyces]MDJ0343009.1 LAETG motif-containing sortase-dependent surface protein [Streptomyces sp. PH10-H1]MDJ0371431.1 LAETG motif-containing sortase-dependent surface protein [Streptomyces sp. H10-C2]